jgi:hypothetical protein
LRSAGAPAHFAPQKILCVLGNNFFNFIALYFAALPKYPLGTQVSLLALGKLGIRCHSLTSNNGALTVGQNHRRSIATIGGTRGNRPYKSESGIGQNRSFGSRFGANPVALWRHRYQET